MKRIILSILFLLFALVSAAFGAGVIQDGFYLTYDTDQLRLIEQYEALERNGPLFAYFPNGEVSKIFQYKNNSRDGLAVAYYPNNRISYRVCFHDGLLHGMSQRYYANGNLSVEMNYRFGQPHGVARFYTETGQLDKIALYDNGRLVKVRPCDASGHILPD